MSVDRSWRHLKNSAKKAGYFFKGAKQKPLKIKQNETKHGACTETTKQVYPLKDIVIKHTETCTLRLFDKTSIQSYRVLFIFMKLTAKLLIYTETDNIASYYCALLSS